MSEFDKVEPKAGSRLEGGEVSLYSRGAIRFCAEDRERWLDEYENVDVYTNEEDCEIGIEPGSDGDYTLSGPSGQTVTVRAAISAIGIEANSLEETKWLPAEYDPSEGLIIIDCSELAEEE